MPAEWLHWPVGLQAVGYTRQYFLPFVLLPVQQPDQLLEVIHQWPERIGLQRQPLVQVLLHVRLSEYEGTSPVQ